MVYVSRRRRSWHLITGELRLIEEQSSTVVVHNIIPFVPRVFEDVQLEVVAFTQETPPCLMNGVVVRVPLLVQCLSESCIIIIMADRSQVWHNVHT